ncbi:hypothetical protein [Hymenobacter weizhouensis]|uniref:hypothetical protein n=1 Tax=Hymenobacter sp. YIM 151500-1 TaxID=2987689 RepID=UPI0022263E7C|nr:hypothetical protein [Hymenobacter sp. YIM 151500-1]UYZ64409.1 hypothetical protein OIS53_06040 [Hymenobacter sp. YIM 151500-1]
MCWGRWQLVTSRLTLAQYEELQALAASSTAVVDAHVTFLRSDGQGTLSTLWGRNCCVSTMLQRFDSRSSVE